MPRPRSANPRDTVVAVRLTRQEVAYIDSQRKLLSRSEWLRWLLLQRRRP